MQQRFACFLLLHIIFSCARFFQDGWVRRFFSWESLASGFMTTNVRRNRYQMFDGQTYLGVGTSIGSNGRPTDGRSLEMLDFQKKREDFIRVARIESKCWFLNNFVIIGGRTDEDPKPRAFRPRKSTKPAIFAALLSITTERRIMVCRSSMISSGHTHLSGSNLLRLTTAYILTATSTQPKSKARGRGSQTVKIQTPATMALRSAAATLAKRVALASAPQVSI
jgi:hypothetical protein